MGEETAVNGKDGAVGSGTGAAESGKIAAVHPTRYRLLPPPNLPYQPRRKEGKGAGGTKFIELNVKSLANSPKSTGMNFWSINPYVGCEFDCTYCYAHYAHKYVTERTHDGDDTAFAQHIFVKQRRAVLNALERDLERIRRQSSLENPATLTIGTATDPYQSAERRFGITRAILERLIDAEGLDLGITTKSPLVCRDVDVLLELGRKHRVTVYISLICSNARLIRLFEQRSPSPQARLRALCRLRDAGINAGINAAPVLPGVTDSVFGIDALVAAAKEANACFVHPSVLRAYPSVREQFLPLIQRHFPNLTQRYKAAYLRAQSAPPNYVGAVERRFERIAQKYGIRSADPFRMESQPRTEPEAQLSLL